MYTLLLTGITSMFGSFAVKPTGDVQFIQGRIVEFIHYPPTRRSSGSYRIIVESEQGRQQNLQITESVFKKLQANPAPVKVHYFSDNSSWIEIQHLSATYTNSAQHSFLRQAAFRILMVVGMGFTAPIALVYWLVIIGSLFPNLPSQLSPFQKSPPEDSTQTQSPDFAPLQADEKPHKRRQRHPARGY
jgi:hypothetical protein